MKLTAVSKRTGPTLLDMHKLIMDGHTLKIRREVVSAMERTGTFQRTGRLKQAMVVRRTPRGAELVAPFDRLRKPATRKAFILMLRNWMNSKAM